MKKVVNLPDGQYTIDSKNMKKALELQMQAIHDYQEKDKMQQQLIELIHGIALRTMQELNTIKHGRTINCKICSNKKLCNIVEQLKATDNNTCEGYRPEE